jgi:hypothetical protein
MLTMFWDSQEVLLSHFRKHGESVNSASYCEVLLKLRDAIRRKRPGQLARGVLLHHDNARPNTAQSTEDRIQELQWGLLEHLSYSPDLTPSDFHLVGLLKKPPWWQTFRWWRGWNRGAEVAEITVKDFCAARFDALVKRWDKCINVGGRYVGKQCFFPGSISHVLRFICISDLFTGSPSYRFETHMSLFNCDDSSIILFFFHLDYQKKWGKREIHVICVPVQTRTKRSANCMKSQRSIRCRNS